MATYPSKLQVSLTERMRSDPDSPEIEHDETETGLTPEQLANDVQRTQEKLVALKREQESLERRKRELEELASRQAEVEQGRNELVEKLTRALVVLERQTVDSRRRVEQLEGAGMTLQEHLQRLEAINVKSWPQGEAPRELTRALGLLDAARNDYNGARARVLSEQTDPETGVAAQMAAAEAFAPGTSHSFKYWLKSGFAFTLPLLVVGLFIFFILCWRAVGTP